MTDTALIESACRAALVAVAAYHKTPPYTEAAWRTVPATDCFIGDVPVELIIAPVLAAIAPRIEAEAMEKAAQWLAGRKSDDWWSPYNAREKQKDHVAGIRALIPATPAKEG